MSVVPFFMSCGYRASDTLESIRDQHPSDPKVQVEELYGVWGFNDHTLQHIDRLRGIGLSKLSADENTIEIAKDGTCRFNTYTTFHPLGKRLISGGKWKLKKAYDEALKKEGWQIEFDLTPTESDLVRTSFFLKRKNGQLIMYGFIDDPDQNQFVEFERKSIKSPTE